MQRTKPTGSLYHFASPLQHVPKAEEAPIPTVTPQPQPQTTKNSTHKIKFKSVFVALPLIFYFLTHLGFSSFSSYCEEALAGICIIYPDLPFCSAMQYREQLASMRALTPNPDIGSSSNVEQSELGDRALYFNDPYYPAAPAVLPVIPPPWPAPVIIIGPGYPGVYPWNHPYFYRPPNNHVVFQNHDHHGHRLTHHFKQRSVVYHIQPGEEVTIPLQQDYEGEQEPHFIVTKDDEKSLLEHPEVSMEFRLADSSQ